MKKKILIGATVVKLAMLLFFITAAAGAQEKTDGAKKVTDAQKEQLKLDDAQYKKAYDVNAAFIKDLQAIKASDEGRMAKMQTMKNLDQNRDAQMKEFLTDSQYKTYLAKKKENRQKMKDYYKDNKG